MPKPSDYQEKVRHGNRMQILTILKDEPMRFSELQNASGMSPRGLARILDELEKSGQLDRTLKGRWPAYEITKKGKISFSKAMTLGIIMDQIEKSDGEYHHNYSGIKTKMEAFGLPWGIQDDIVINKDVEKEISPILFEVIRDIQKNIYLKIKDISKIRKIDVNKKHNKILLGLIIEYDELIKSINENSLEVYQNMNKQGKKPTGKFAKASKEFLEFDKI